jgi:hypothetical protein
VPGFVDAGGVIHDFVVYQCVVPSSNEPKTTVLLGDWTNERHSRNRWFDDVISAGTTAESQAWRRDEFTAQFLCAIKRVVVETSWQPNCRLRCQTEDGDTDAPLVLNFEHPKACHSRARKKQVA